MRSNRDLTFVYSGKPEVSTPTVEDWNERASLVGAKLTVWSELDSGTEVELSIPASIAYAASAMDDVSGDPAKACRNQSPRKRRMLSREGPVSAVLP